MEKKSNLGWHIRFFDRYLGDRVCPQGLRIQIFPSFEVTDSQFKEEWEQNLNSCSADLIKMLKNKYSIELSDLDKEIEVLKTNGHQIASNADFQRREKELMQYLENYNKDIVMKKENKFYKDKLAFSGGYAYRWPRGHYNRQGRFPRSNNNNKNMKTSYKSDSDVSVSSSSVSSYKPPPKTTRGSHGRGRLPKRGNSHEHQNNGGSHKRQMMSPQKYPPSNPNQDQVEGASGVSGLGISTPLPLFEDMGADSQRELGAVPKTTQGRNSNPGSVPLGSIPNPPATPMTQRSGKMDSFVIKQPTLGRD